MARIMTPDEARHSITARAKTDHSREAKHRQPHPNWLAVFTVRILCEHKNLRVIPNPATQYYCDDCEGRP